MGMGSAPENVVQETELSKEQFKILDERESLYQNFIQPELKSYYQSAKEFTLDDDYLNFDHMPGIAQGNMELAFDSQGNDLEKLLGQRGTDSKGASELLKTQGQLAGSKAYNQAQLQSILQHNNLINKENKNTVTEANMRQNSMGLLTSQAPGTTQSAPIFFHQKPEEKGMMAQLSQMGLGAASSFNSMGGGGMGGMGGGSAAGGDSGMSAFTSSNTSGQGFM